MGRNSHDDLGIGGRGQTQGAIFTPDRGAEQPELGHLRHQFGRPFVGMIELLRRRDDLSGDPAIDHVEEGRLVVGLDLAQGRRRL